MEGRDGHGAAPEDEVLGEFADLGEREGVGLGELEEAACKSVRRVGVYE